MTSRFSYFSHIEDLANGQLVLTSPFMDTPDKPSICKYELHHGQADILAPDDGFSGIAAYHRLLPLQANSKSLKALSHQPVWSGTKRLTPSSVPTLAQCENLTPNPALPWLVTQAQAEEAGVQSLVYPAMNPGDFAFLKWTKASNHRLAVPEAWRAACPPSPRVHFYKGPLQKTTWPSNTSYAGPWHHPFRLEGMKLAGLDLFNRFPESPTIVLFDPTGEWLLALALAFDSIRRLVPSSMPFRLVLVQYQPYDHICKLFEGRPYDGTTLDQATHPAYLPLPDPLPDLLKDTVYDTGGTCVAIPPVSDQNEETRPWFYPALEILSRTQFIEDEDRVILLNPFQDPCPSPAS